MAAVVNKPLTNCFLLRKTAGQVAEVVLGQKKRGWMVGIWNGYGGKLEPGETVEQAAARELQEGWPLQSVATCVLTFI